MSIASKDLVGVEISLVGVALTADRHILVSASDHTLVVLMSHSKGEGCALLTDSADGGQLLNLLTLRDKF